MERGGMGNQRESSESLNTKMEEAISQKTKIGLANGSSLFWICKFLVGQISQNFFG
jgi:hypothetical protein